MEEIKSNRLEKNRILKSAPTTVKISREIRPFHVKYIITDNFIKIENYILQLVGYNASSLVKIIANITTFKWGLQGQ